MGTARRIDGRLKFVPDDCPAISMQMMRDCEGGAKDGDKVAVEILQRGNRQEDHRVGVAMRFGSSDEAKRCAKALLYAQDIRSRFPDKVREEAKKLENAEVSEKDTEGRMDLRALPIFTIDSAETKDIDDAISLTKTPEAVLSWVSTLQMFPTMSSPAANWTTKRLTAQPASTMPIRWCPCCPSSFPTASAA